MAALDVLRKARELYAANPSHAPADDELEAGRVCLLSSTADARDALGAQVDYEDEYEADRLIRKAIGVEFSWPYVATWNASHSTEEVLALIDSVIAEQEDPGS